MSIRSTTSVRGTSVSAAAGVADGVGGLRVGGALRTPYLMLLRLAVALAIVAVWQAAVEFGLVRPLFLAPPTAVLQTLWELVRDGSLWTHIAVTVQATLIGFALGMVAGVVTGFLLGLSPTAASVFVPFITMANSTPRIALAPLFVVWFGLGLTSRVVLVVSLVYFVALTNTLSGTLSADRDHLVLARIYGATRLDLIRRVLLPTTVPWILAAMRLSLAYALAAAVVGEMFLSQEGLGFLIVSGSGVFNISLIFAALLATVLLAYLLDVVLTLIERRLLRWRE